MIVKGDVNGDGKIDWEDLALAEAIVFKGLIQPTDVQILAGDVNDDGVFDYDDVEAIKNHCLLYVMIDEVIE